MPLIFHRVRIFWSPPKKKAFSREKAFNKNDVLNQNSKYFLFPMASDTSKVYLCVLNFVHLGKITLDGLALIVDYRLTIKNSDLDRLILRVGNGQ